MGNFTWLDHLANGTLFESPIGGPLSEVLLYVLIDSSLIDIGTDP